MRYEDSLFLVELHRRVNRRLWERMKAGYNISEDSIEEILELTGYDIVDDAEKIAPKALAQFRQEVRKRRKVRSLNDMRVRRANEGRLGSGFEKFKELLVVVDAFLHEIGDAVFEWYAEEEHQRNSRLLGTEGVGGLGLKAFMFLSLNSRACAIASEILLLTRQGYPDGAASRLRSLYENLVVMNTLSNAEQVGEFEIIERYCAWSAVEAKKERSSAGANLPRGVEVPDAQIPDLERRAMDRWGREFFKPNGWALPLFPGRRGGVQFAEIDRIAGIQDLRSVYLQGNSSIHAGPTSVLRRIDFSRWDDVFVSDPEEEDLKEARATMLNAIYLLVHSALTMHYIIAQIIGNPDIRFFANPLGVAAKHAYEAFKESENSE
ncbi:DUF5677 domain-containing protein [Streptomyces sp. NPDC000134]|uniref:DUF5677 domain-containing protein n=1 Tax=Streptomyces sp. NPDC000134 TaxID=3364536 RepID=UPI0036AE28CF